MTDKSERIACAVATANGFAMPIRSAQSAACKRPEFTAEPYRQIVRLWLAGLRLLQAPIFLL
jgi:hypothetical protein